MTLLSISANDIDTAGRALDVELPVAWLSQVLADADVLGVAPGRLVARLSRSGSDIVARGRVRATVSTPCARCLNPAQVGVDTELSLLLRPAPKAAAAQASSQPTTERGRSSAASSKKSRPKEPEYEFSAEEAELDTYDGDTVVLDGFVREAILLEMPNFPLCSPACPGIGPAASEEEASSSAPGLDSRLAPLDALRAKLERKGRSSSRPPQVNAGHPRETKNVTQKKTKKE